MLGTQRALIGLLFSVLNHVLGLQHMKIHLGSKEKFLKIRLSWSFDSCLLGVLRCVCDEFIHSDGRISCKVHWDVS